MDGELVFIRGGAEGKPGRGANREGFVKASREGREEGRVIRGGGGRVNPQESDRTVGVDFGRKGEREGAVGGAEDVCCDVWEGGGYGVTVRMWGVNLPGGIEPAGGCREGGGSGGVTNGD